MSEEYVAVANLDDLPEGQGKEVRVGDRLIALFRVGDQVYAIDALCPHRGGPLAEGPLDGTVVTCPWHAWQFDVQTGKNVHNPAIGVQTYEVQVRDGRVLIRLPA